MSEFDEFDETTCAEYAQIIMKVFKSERFMYLKVASGKCKYLRKDWIEELFDGRLPEKQLAAVTLYLNDDLNLDSLLGFIDKRSKEERDHQMETCAFMFSLGLTLH